MKALNKPRPAKGAKGTKASKGGAGLPRVPAAAHRALQKTLEYEFKDVGLLAEAMTHSSSETLAAGLPNNERLEFLGDRVLGLLTAEALSKEYPDASEGDLAPRLNELVRKETLAEIARELGLDKCLVLSHGEEKSGGRNKPALLADACEALIAALYKDGGFRAVKKMYQTYWAERLKSVMIVPRDAKTRLQEWAQGAGHGTPSYKTLARTGPDHAPLFTLEVRVDGRGAYEGQGGSKRDAEQAAAAAFLAAERINSA